MSKFAALMVALVVFAPLRAVEATPVQQQLQIVTASGSHPFAIEFVRSRADMEKGLMFRKTMAADHGMLFDFGKPQTITMWMKNTYLPLDMVFIAPDGHVVHVVEHAAPMSEAIISSESPALSVLEVNAGIAEKIGVKAGDLVKAPLFKN